jgi:hypothetical protein
MEKVFIAILMALIIRANGKIVNWMEKVYFIILQITLPMRVI